MGKSALAANFLENAARAGTTRPSRCSRSRWASPSSRSASSRRRGRSRATTCARARCNAWPKVTAAAQRARRQPPLWIDDSSDLSVLDIRAKARRLAQQQVDGELGLIVVDYLQLMRADSAVDSVVEQIGEISKGLKTLARELQVPVIALSQLSRARRAAPRQAADALRPALVRPDRAGRRPRDVHLPRGVLRGGLRAPGRGRAASSPSTATAGSATSSCLPARVPALHARRPDAERYW